MLAAWHALLTWWPLALLAGLCALFPAQALLVGRWIGWRGLVALALALALWVQTGRLHGLQAKLQGSALAAAKADARAAKAEAAALAAARAKEQERVESLARIVAAYERGKTDAQAQGNRLAADLRAGNERLRDLWQGCKARVPGPAAGAGEPDPADGLRAASAGRIVAAVAACQAQRDALIDVVEADRR